MTAPWPPPPPSAPPPSAPPPADRSPLPHAVAPAAAAPIGAPRPRFDGVDLARALAIGGMLVAHYVARGEPGPGDAVRGFVDGRAMPLFVVLFGVSVTLLARGAAHPDRTLLLRAAVFLPLGLVLQEATVGILVILPSYALYGVAAIGLRRLGDRALLVGAALVAAAGAVTDQILAPRWPTYTQWDGGRGLVPPWKLLANLTVNGPYPAVPSLAFVMVGLWLGRRRLDDVRTAARLVVVGALVGLVGYAGGRAVGDRVGATGVYLDAEGEPRLVKERRDEVAAVLGYKPHQIDEIEPDDARLRRLTFEQMVRYTQDRVAVFHAERVFDTTGHSQMPAWTFGATGTACAALGLCLLAARRLRHGLGPLLALGRMSLTAYAVQAVAIRWTPSLEHSTMAGQYAVTLALAAALVAFAALWGRWFRRGPLESLLHALTRA